MRSAIERTANSTRTRRGDRTKEKNQNQEGGGYKNIQPMTYL